MDKPQTSRGIDFGDQTLTCCDCGCDFTWSLGEQLYFRDRKLSPPRRCPQCREARRKRTTPTENQHTDTVDPFAAVREELKKWQ